MGKSDPYVFNFYASQLTQLRGCNKAAYFGQSGKNPISNYISAKNEYFYDLSLGNWEINSFPYEIVEKFDLIVCTRCAYFSKSPKTMLEYFKKILSDDGILFLDWGLGDHWRFDKFKVGWIKDGEHEWAYKKDNFLWSCYISKKMLESSEFYEFEKNCKKFGYDSIKEAINQEVKHIVCENQIQDLGLAIEKETYLFLWPNSPQLYSCLTLRNS